MENKKFPKNYFIKNKIRPLLKTQEKDFHWLTLRQYLSEPSTVRGGLFPFIKRKMVSVDIVDKIKTLLCGQWMMIQDASMCIMTSERMQHMSFADRNHLFTV